MSNLKGETHHGWLHLFVITVSMITIYPVLWVFTIAFSGKQQLAIADLPETPTFWDRIRAIFPWPETLSLSNFVDLFTEQPFLRWMGNSLVVSIGTTVLGVVLSCTAAYAFSRFRFPGRRSGLMIFLVSQMFPGTLMLVPLYIIIVSWLGLGNTFLGCILIYTTIALPFCTWMLKGYFDTIPIEIEESALMDGASQGLIFTKIVLPLAKPAIVVTGLFSFITGWNEFIIASLIMEEEVMYTAPVGLKFFVGGFSTEWGYFAAGSIIVSIPVVILFAYTQKYLVSGLTAGSVKG